MHIGDGYDGRHQYTAAVLQFTVVLVGMFTVLFVARTVIQASDLTARSQAK